MNRRSLSIFVLLFLFALSGISQAQDNTKTPGEISQITLSNLEATALNLSAAKKKLATDLFFDFNDGTYPSQVSYYNSGSLTYVDFDGVSVTVPLVDVQPTLEANAETYQNSFSVRSGAITDNQGVGFVVGIEKIGPGGAELDFKYRVSSELNYDYFHLCINEVCEPGNKRSGEIGWADFPTQTLVEGDSLIQFFYTKDVNTLGGLDAFFMDNFTLTRFDAPANTTPTISNIHPNAAIPGTSVEIYGSSFSTTPSNNTVTFDGTAVTVTAATPTKLTVTVPDMGWGFKSSIVVSNSNGSSSYSGFFNILQIDQGGLFDRGQVGVFDAPPSQNLITPGDFPNSRGPSSVYSADLDGDGDLDVLAAFEAGEDIIAWYRNNGNGVFGSEQIIRSFVSSTENPKVVHAADLDGDGDQDVLYATSNGISWHRNNGIGGFGSTQIILASTTFFNDVYTADLDGDGDLDVLSASSSDDQIAWYANDGNGGFGSQQMITTSADAAISVYTVDLDGDGDQDVLSASQLDNKIAWYANDGNGGFGSQQIITTLTDFPRDVYATDLDGDGDQDVLIASSGDDIIAWYANDGIGGFGSQQVITLLADRVNDVHTADLDGDGDQDVLSTSELDSKIAWYANDGNGGFGSQQVISRNGGSPQSVYTADIDGDGDEDVLATLTNLNDIAWYENTTPIIIPTTISQAHPTSGIPGTEMQLFGTAFNAGGGSESTNVLRFYDANTNAFILSTNTWISESSNALTFDLPASLTPGPKRISITVDGGEEVLYPKIITVLDAGKGGDFETEQVLLSGLVDEPRGFDFADLDDDGIKDLIYTARNGSQIGWSKSNGDGTFGSVNIVSSNTGLPWDVISADIDNDGDLDIIGSAQTGNKIVSYLNNGNSTFGSETTITTIAGTALALEVADLDQDGYPDLISSSLSDNKIAWYKNNGDGTFGSQQVLSSQSNDQPYEVIAIDLDDDGLLDVVAGMDFVGALVWYRNLGGGDFSARTIITDVSASIRDFDFLDVDNDGDQDLVTANFDEGEVAWFANNGDGIFTGKNSISLDVTQVTTIEVGDIDGDGFQDLVAAPYTNAPNDRISIFINTGSASFQFKQLDQPTTGITEYYEDIELVDVDGDNVLDIVGSSVFGDYFLFYKNVSPPPYISYLSQNSAAAGASLTIYGKDFLPTASDNIINFGTTPAQITAATSNTITVTVPNSPTGLSSISITNDNGTYTYLKPFSILNNEPISFEIFDSNLSTANNFADGDDDVVFEDLDGDGDLDIVLLGSVDGGAQNGITRTYINDGSGVYTLGQTLANVYNGSIAVADIDGDNDQDIYITGSSNTLGITDYFFINNGSGSFTNISGLGVDVEAVSLSDAAFADVDNDGDMDLLTTGQNPSGVRITDLYLNSGSGDFTASSNSFVGLFQSDLDFGDVDGDGDLDLMIVGRNAAFQIESTLYLNDGAGSFINSSQIFDIELGKVKFGDLDNDGDLDLLGTGSSQSGDSASRIFLNDGTGSFTVNSTIDLGYSSFPQELADFDGDGDLDILLNVSSASFRLYLNDGAASFSPSNAYFNRNDGKPIAIGDIDSDGDLDIFSLGRNSGDINIQLGVVYKNTTPIFSITGLNRKAGLPGSQLTIYGSGFSTTPSENVVTIGTTIVNVEEATSSTLVVTLPQEEPGDKFVNIFKDSENRAYTDRFTLLSSKTIYFTDSGPQLENLRDGDISIGDFNKDGNPDLLLSGVDVAGNPNRRFYSNNGLGGFNLSSINLSVSGLSSSSTDFGDIDNDGDVDLLLSGINTGANTAVTSLYINNGNNTFTISSSALLLAWGGDVRFGDMNSDGALDILTSGQTSISSLQTVTTTYKNLNGDFYLNDAPFNIIGSTSNGETRLETEFVDIDGDKDLDIVVTSNEQNGTFENLLYLNDGSGYYSDPISIIPEVVRETAIDFGDLDNDGDIDIVVTGSSQSGVPASRIFLNDGNLNFTPNGGLEGLTNGTSDLFDADGDGDLDWFFTGRNQGGARFAYLAIGNNTGGFDYSNISFEGVEESSVATVDYDFDGDLDIVVSGLDNSNNPLTKVYENAPLDFAVTDLEPNYSTSGSNLSIYGALFSSTPSQNTVEIGGQIASIISATSGKLLVNVPNLSPGQSAVEVTVDGNTEDGRTTRYGSNLGVLQSGGAELEEIDLGIPAYQSSAFGFSDVDNDGDVDILITGIVAGTAPLTSLMLNDGTGNYTVSSTSGLPNLRQGSVDFGDIDNDGDEDVVISGLNPGLTPETLIYFNNGDGTFVESTNFIDGIRAGDTKFVDLNQNGYLDLIVTGTSTGSNALSFVYFNNGSGGFNLAYNLTGLRQSKINHADVNGDGYKDVLIAGINISGTAQTILYLNQQDGTLSPAASVLENVYDANLFFADLNQDNNVDIVYDGLVGTSSRVVKSYLNNGSGTFTELPIALNITDDGALEVGDINGDGYPDLIALGNTVSVNGATETSSRVYFNDKVNGFIRSNQTLPFETTNKGTLGLLDFNSDGYLDVIATGRYTGGTTAINSTRIFENKPSRPGNLVASVVGNSIELNWEAPKALPITSYDIYRSTTAGSDVTGSIINGSQVNDTTYIDANIQENTKYYYRVVANDSLSGSTTSFSDEVVVSYKLKTFYSLSSFEGVPGNTVRLFGSNLTTNPNEVIVSLGSTQGQVISSTLNGIEFTVPDITPGEYFINTTINGVLVQLPLQFSVLNNVDRATGFLRDRVGLLTGLTGIYNSEAYDLNGDQYDDLIFATSGDNSVKVGLNDQNKGISNVVTITNSITGEAIIEVNDIDRDGFLDIIIADPAQGFISWFKNDGLGDFQEEFTITLAANGVSSILSFDVDGNGSIDIIATEVDDSEVTWYSNDGAGSFTYGGQLSTPTNSRELVHIDANTDGLLDIAVTAGVSQVYLQTNFGDSLGGPQSLTNGDVTNISKLYSADLDGEGSTDLIFISEGDSKISWLQSDVTIGFTGSIPITILDNLGPQPVIEIVDIDGDGDVDIIYGDTSESPVRVLTNDGTGTFTSSDISTVAVSDLRSLDYDNDGDQDILIISANDESLSVFENIDQPPFTPSNFAVNVGVASADLSWDPNTEADFAGFDILRSSFQDRGFTSLSNGSLTTNTGFTDTGLRNTESYFYQIVAVDNSDSRSVSETIGITAFAPQISDVSPNQGLAGETITINGANFDASSILNEVRFGEVTANVVSADTNKITVEVPSGVEPGSSVITLNSNGYEYVHVNPFIVLSPNNALFALPFTESSLSGSFTKSAAANIDDDDIAELFVPMPSTSTIAIFSTTTDNPFANRIDIQTTGRDVTVIKPIDLLGDVYPHMVFISSSNNEFGILRNLGNQTVTTDNFETIIISDGVDHTNISDIQSADMNNDGLNDIVLSSSDGKISWYQNLSRLDSIFFSTGDVITTTANGVNSFKVADLNSDGFKDIVASEVGNNSLSWYQNSSDGTFTKNEIASITELVDVELSDYDKDGDLDVISLASSAIDVYQNNGDATFSSSVSTQTITMGTDFEVIDIDADGFEDIIVTSSTNEFSSFFQNNGSGDFNTSSPIYNIGEVANSILVYDLNNDGKLDVLTHSDQNSTLYFMRNIIIEGLVIESFGPGTGNLLRPDDAIDIVFETGTQLTQNIVSAIENSITVSSSTGITLQTGAFSASENILTINEPRLIANSEVSVIIGNETLELETQGEFYIDVNNDGVRDLNDDIYTSESVQTTLVGDFDRNGLVNFEDLVAFSDGWRNNNFEFETAPFTTLSGSVFPQITLETDQTFNIEDLITFIRNWNVSQNQNKAVQLSKTLAKTSADEPSIAANNNQIEIIKKSSSNEYTEDGGRTETTYEFVINHSGLVKALHLELEFNPNIVTIKKIQEAGLFDVEKSENSTMLSRIDSVNGLANLQFVNFGELKSINGNTIVEVTFESKQADVLDITLVSDIRAEGEEPVKARYKSAFNSNDELPISYELKQNYPNPFNPSTNIQYSIKEAGKVRLTIYSVTGQKIAELVNGEQNAGRYLVRWDASALASGLYLYDLSVNGQRITKKMMLIK